jgi:hypothetical protein
MTKYFSNIELISVNCVQPELSVLKHYYTAQKILYLKN